MNDPFQADSAFEKELASLAPRELSNGFLDSLEDQLAAPVRPPSILETRGIGWRGRWTSVAAIAAMILVSTWIFWNRPVDDNSFRSKQDPIGPVEAGQPNVLDLHVPSLLAFSQAMNDSQIDLNDLLDQHARTLLPSVPDQFSPVNRWQ